MNFKKGKVFIKEKAELIPYIDGQDYYDLIKNCGNKGYTQIILTTDFILEIFKYYFIKRKFNLVEIIPLDDDEIEMKNKFKQYTTMLEEDRDNFTYIISDLDFLSKEKNSVDIFKIELKGSSLNGKRVRINIQINGIIHITDTCYEDEKAVLCEIINKHLSENRWKTKTF